MPPPLASQPDPAAAGLPGPGPGVDPLLGRTLGRYRIISMIGRGGMGVVYRAEHVDLRKPVALKILLPERMVSPEAAQRFLREARAAAGLEHPNVVTVHDVGQEDGILFLVMQFIDGPSVAGLVSERGALPPPEAVNIALGVARGLGAAHAKGLIHRDVKPDNILIEKQRGEVKLTDFGLARAVEDEETLTQIGEVLGTPGYIAPELSSSEGPVDHRCDLYSLGATLFHMLSGRAPFRGSSPLATIVSSLQEPAPSVCQLQPTVPGELGSVVAALLERNPAARPQTCLEVENLLISALNVAQTGKTVLGVDMGLSALGPGGVTSASGAAPTRAGSVALATHQRATNPTVALPGVGSGSTGGTVSLEELGQHGAPPVSAGGGDPEESSGKPLVVWLGVGLAAAVLLFAIFSAVGSGPEPGAGPGMAANPPPSSAGEALANSGARTESPPPSAAPAPGASSDLEHQLRALVQRLSSLEEELGSSSVALDAVSRKRFDERLEALRDQLESLGDSVKDDLDLLLDVGDLGERLKVAQERLQQRPGLLPPEPPTEPREAAAANPEADERKSDARPGSGDWSGGGAIELPRITHGTPRGDGVSEELLGQLLGPLRVVAVALREGRYGDVRKIALELPGAGGRPPSRKPNRQRPEGRGAFRKGRGFGGEGRQPRGGEVDRPPPGPSQHLSDLILSFDHVLKAALRTLQQRVKDGEPVDLFLRNDRKWLPCVVERIKFSAGAHPESAQLFLQVHRHPEEPFEEQIALAELWGSTVTALAREGLKLHKDRRHRDGMLLMALAHMDLTGAFATFEASGRSSFHPLLANWAVALKASRDPGLLEYLDLERRAREVLGEAADLHRSGQFRAEEKLLLAGDGRLFVTSTFLSLRPALDRHLKWLSQDVNQRVAAKIPNLFRAMFTGRSARRDHLALEYKFATIQRPNVMGDWFLREDIGDGSVDIADGVLVFQGESMVTFGPRWSLGELILDLIIDESIEEEGSEIAILLAPSSATEESGPCLVLRLKSSDGGGLDLLCLFNGKAGRRPQQQVAKHLYNVEDLWLQVIVSPKGLIVNRKSAARGTKRRETILEARQPADGRFPLMDGLNRLTVMVKSPNGNVRLRGMSVSFLPERGWLERHLDPRAGQSHEAVRLPDDLPTIDEILKALSGAGEEGLRGAGEERRLRPPR